jgi:integrase/recombinase XerD
MTQLNETVSPLRPRMIDDMTMHKLSSKSLSGCLPSVTKLVKYMKHSPANATAEEVRQFQIALAEQVSPPVSRYSKVPP